MIDCLCNGCLRVSRIEREPDDGEARCGHCGAEICWCGGCMETLALLRGGVRDPSALNLQGKYLPEWRWSETGGYERIRAPKWGDNKQ